MRYHYTHIKWLNKNNLAMSSADKDEEQLQFYIVGGNANCTATWKIVAIYKIRQCHLAICRRKCVSIRRSVYECLYFIYDYQTLETTQMSFNWWTDF